MSLVSPKLPGVVRLPRCLSPTTAGIAAAGRDNNFNLLRLGLATLVLFGHSWELVDGDRHRDILTRIFGTTSLGDLAVDGFFLLSGWLIVQSWQREPALGRFLYNRILRIYPAFLVASVVSAAVVGPLGSDPFRYVADFQPLRFLGFASILQSPAVPPVFEGQPYPYVNGAMWTIDYEARCYLLVACLGLCGVIQRRWLWLSLAATAVGLLLVPTPLNYVWFRGSSYLLGSGDELIRFVAFFSSGGCFYLFRRAIPFKASWALAAVPVLLGSLFWRRTTNLGLLSLGAYLLFWFVFTSFPRLARFRQLPDISYGTYLYGWPIQKLWLWYWPSLAPWALFPLTLLLCYPCGWLSWTYVEQPLNRFKWHPKRTVSSPSAAEDAPRAGRTRKVTA